jgi:AraC family transcriptional regulator
MRLEPGMFLGRLLHLRACGGLTLTHYEYAAGVDLPWHEHERAYLSFPLSGGYEERHGAASCECSAGRAVFHPSGERHADRFVGEGASIFSVELDDASTEQLRDAGIVTDRRIDLQSAGTVRRAEVLLRLATHGDVVPPARLDAAAIELLASLPSRAAERVAPRWMRCVIDALHASPRRPALSELASVAGVHPVHLARTFRQIQGCSIGNYVRKLRLDRAITLIESASMPLADVALTCGFADQSHLNREFRRITGVTPSRWRAKRVQDSAQSAR